MLFKNQDNSDRVQLFTAAQAANKWLTARGMEDEEFTAAQAANKKTVGGAVVHGAFTAAQAANKGWRVHGRTGE